MPPPPTVDGVWRDLSAAEKAHYFSSVDCFKFVLRRASERCVVLAGAEDRGLAALAEWRTAAASSGTCSTNMARGHRHFASRLREKHPDLDALLQADRGFETVTTEDCLLAAALRI